MQIVAKFLLILLSTSLAQCFHGNAELDAPIALAPRGPKDAPAIEVPVSAIVNADSQGQSDPSPAIGDPEMKANTPNPIATALGFNDLDPCVVVEDKGRPPYFLPEHGFVVTNIVKSCVTREGESGFEQKSPWMAMGIPCTGGMGRMTLKGRSYAPTSVSFELPSNCPMLPGNAETVRKLGSAALGISPENQLLSFTPLSVQYWEFVDFPDAGSGTSVQFNTTIGLQKGWSSYKAGDLIPVRLYGRENSWINQQIIYQVDASIKSAGDGRFSLELRDVNRLDSESMGIVRNRCQKIHPTLNCHKIF